VKVAVNQQATYRVKRESAASVEAGALFHRTELILRGGGEKPLCAEVVGKCFLAPTGPRLQVSFRDVTDRREAAEKLRELSGRLLSLQDEERRRIARELHDSTAQNLSALEMNLVLLEKQLPSGAAKARSILTDSRNIAERSHCRSVTAARDFRYHCLPPEQGWVWQE
jgi:signal transduction histidine kinase